MWPFMYKESDWVFINDDLRGKKRRNQINNTFKRVSLKAKTRLCSYFEDEVWRRARSHCGSEDPVVVRVDQRLIQIQNQNLPLYCIWG